MVIIWSILRSNEDMTTAPATKAPGIAIFFNTLFFQNQVRIFPATLLQISSSLRSRCDYNLKYGGSSEVQVGISESGYNFSRYDFVV